MILVSDVHFGSLFPWLLSEFSLQPGKLHLILDHFLSFTTCLLFPVTTGLPNFHQGKSSLEGKAHVASLPGLHSSTGPELSR